MKMRISIIIPVYNTGEVLNRTIQSILNQSFKDYEILLIDDGSDKLTREICKKIVNKDCRVRYYHQINSGLCAARNVGIDIASGEYIMFVDHDDLFIDDDGLKKINKLLQKYEVDVLKFDYQYFYAKKKITRHSEKKINTDFYIASRSEFEDRYEFLREQHILTYIWDGIYKRSFIQKNKIKFDTSFYMGGEDIEFLMTVSSYITRLFYCSSIIYQYNVYDTSTYNSADYNKLKRHLTNLKKIIEKEKRIINSFANVNAERIYKSKIKEINVFLGFIASKSILLNYSQIKELLRKSRSSCSLTLDEYCKGSKYYSIKKRVLFYLYINNNAVMLAIMLKIYSLKKYFMGR